MATATKDEKALTPQVKLDSVRTFLVEHKEQLATALPKFLTPERMMRTALTEIGRNPTLLECTPASLFGAIIQSAQLGLEIGIMGQAYLVPFWSGKKKRFEVQFLPGYKGLLSLARRSREVAKTEAHEVYENDVFDYAYGTDSFLKHKPSKSARGALIAFYAVAKLANGASQFEVMSKQEIDAHRDKYSRAAKEGPWVTDYDAMAKKTVLRKLCKFLPASVELQTAIALDEYAEAQLSQRLGAITGLAAEVDDDSESLTAQRTKLDDGKKALAEQRGDKPHEQQPDRPAEKAPEEGAPPPTIDLNAVAVAEHTETIKAANTLDHLEQARNAADTDKRLNVAGQKSLDDVYLAKKAELKTAAPPAEQKSTKK